jgi:hypothetical protein
MNGPLTFTRGCAGLARSLNVGDDWHSPFAEPGAAAVTFTPKITDAPDPGGVTESHDNRREIGVEPPAQIAVELLGAIDV